MTVLADPHLALVRSVIRGRDPQEVPTTSRRALGEAGFEVIEHQRPSFLFDRSVLVTGEMPRPLHRVASPACHGNPVRRGIRPQHRRHPLPTVPRSRALVWSDAHTAAVM